MVSTQGSESCDPSSNLGGTLFMFSSCLQYFLFIARKVQAFCEEKVLRCLLGVFWYAESKNQCWQAEKWRLHYLICIFFRVALAIENALNNRRTQIKNR